MARPSSVPPDWFAPGCGFELWDLKTASDPDAHQIAPAMHDATIQQLASIPHGFHASGARVRGAETTTWKLINVHLLAVNVEKDQDYHLVLGDGLWTMIAEIPSPGCLPSTSVVRSAVSEARRRMDMYLRSGQHSEVLTIAGVGFFDREHNQTGAAVNQLELHPVVAICFGQDCRLGRPHDLELATESGEQSEQRKRREALQHDMEGFCRTHAAAARAMEEYRDFLSSCRTWDNYPGHIYRSLEECLRISRTGSRPRGWSLPS